MLAYVINVLWGHWSLQIVIHFPKVLIPVMEQEHGKLECYFQYRCVWIFFPFSLNLSYGVNLFAVEKIFLIISLIDLLVGHYFLVLSIYTLVFSMLVQNLNFVVKIIWTSWITRRFKSCVIKSIRTVRSVKHLKIRLMFCIPVIKPLFIMVHQIGSLVMRSFVVTLSYKLLNSILIPSKVSCSFIDCWKFYYLV